MSRRCDAASGTSSTFSLKLPRTGPTPTFTTASKCVASWTVTLTISGKHRPTFSGSVTKVQTRSRPTGICSSPLYCRFTPGLSTNYVRCGSKVRLPASSLRLPVLGITNGTPDLVTRQRHVDVPHAQRRQRVDDGVDKGGRAADIRTLADPLGADGMVRTGRHGVARLPVWRFLRG